ncbi:MAG TPA: TonB-dependent receptor [Steroidobacteraceae bacterium]|nr:TonB-dependent receptor [Steroidobacteraceae bacterium]
MSPRWLAVLAASACLPAIAAAAPSPAVLEEITISASPLGGMELPADRVPGNIQRVTSEDIERARAAGLAQLLNGRLGSVFINEAQANLLQPDVQFRGFVASPLLGQPQGMAVYQDGVRINDPFGDVVNWALVPEPAIASVDLIPGSNPVYGLNTLGGALAIRTKDGFTHAGTQGEFSGGSFGRAVAEIESGASSGDRWSYYGSARYLTEDGWRQFSPSDAVHLFGDLGRRSDRSSLDLSFTWVATELIGNGPAPVQLLDIERDAIYTHPDRTENSLAFLALSGNHGLAQDLELMGVAHFRRSDIETLNGDDSSFEACDAEPALVCEESEEGGEQELALDQNGAVIPFSAAVDGATLNRSSTQQDTYGASVQLGITKPLARRENRLIVGGSIDRSSVRFASSTELGRLDATRGALPGGFLAGDACVDLDARIENAGVFFTDTLAITPRIDVTLAGRYNEARVELRDQIDTDLDGDHRFSRFNGAAGVTYRPREGLRFYANYSGSNRVPSPVELTCADEDDPCSLPNAFLSDPPLDQVISTTVEAGVNGSRRGLRWHAGLFRTTNRNEILFVSAGRLTNQGFFDNAGDTRRQGVEVNLDGRLFDERVRWFAHYTALDAEFREGFQVMSLHHPAALEGEIAVTRGARIPGIPGHVLKAGGSVRLARGVTIDIDVMRQSGQFLRGDEGNLLAPLPGFTVASAGAEWRLSRNLTFFAQIENLLDEDYASFGLLGAPGEVLGEELDDPRFVSPGAPRSGWVGVKWAL